MSQYDSPDLKVHDQRVEFITSTLNQFLESLKDFHLDFPLKEGGNMADLNSLKAGLRESLVFLAANKPFTKLIFSFLTEKHFNIADELDTLDNLIEKAEQTKPEIKNTEWLNLDCLWGGADEDLLDLQAFPQINERVMHKQRLADITLAYLLQTITMNRMNDCDTSHPQNFRHILSYFSEKQPEFLLIFESMINIILVQDKFAIQEKGRASRTLINNYKVEELILYISSDRSIVPEDKAFIFSWLMAYQKLYRRLLEELYDKKSVKKKISELWFKGESNDELLSESHVAANYYKLPQYVREFIDATVRDDMARAWEIGRRLVLTVNNEDILRIMCGIIHEDCDILGNMEWYKKTYSVIYEIISEYRRLCKDLISAYPVLKKEFSEISRERRIAETIISPPHKTEDRTPILGKKTYHELLEETRENLKESNLIHLFEIWPIPEISQQLFNQICKLKTMIPQDRIYMIQHYLYREKVLEFLMQLDRVGIHVKQHTYLPLLTNAYQLDSLDILKKGLVFASTGHWKMPIVKPPSILCFTNPHAIGNCKGQMLRHVVMRIFLATGEFYESPFVLDSTLRYGQMDEDGGVDALVIRPGLFMVDIPERIKKHWDSLQNQQMKKRLGKVVAEKIRQENTIG